MNITSRPTLTLIKELPATIGQINAVAISPDRNWIATAGGSSQGWNPRGNRTSWSLQVYDRSWEKIDLAQKNAYQPHETAINSICFSAENQLITASLAERNQMSIAQWNIDRQRTEFAMEPNEQIFAVIVSPDGKFFFTVKGWGAMKKFSTKLGNLVYDWSRSDRQNVIHNPIYALAISKDSKYLYTGGEDCKIVAWDTRYGKEVRINFSYHDKAIHALCLSNDDRIIVSGSDQRIKIWDARTGELLHSFYAHADWVKGLAITPDGRFLISAGDGKIKIWDLATGEKLTTIVAHARPIRSIALSRDGSTLVSGAADGIVKVWQVDEISEVEGI
jgi:COMPASS component SWD3